MENQKGASSILIILTIVGVLLVGGGVWYYLVKITYKCTMEAKVCPNGTTVGRTGPNCEFAKCPVENETFQKEVINSFSSQWKDIQKDIPTSPILGSSGWFLDNFQFIGNGKMLILFEDGHIMLSAIYSYQNNNVIDNFEFSFIEVFRDMPFNFPDWQNIISQYGNKHYSIATYAKDVVRGGQIVIFPDWTKVPENIFVRNYETADWKTYRNEEYGFEVKYPLDWTSKGYWSEDGDFFYIAFGAANSIDSKPLATLRVYPNQTTLDKFIKYFDYVSGNWKDTTLGGVTAKEVVSIGQDSKQFILITSVKNSYGYELASTVFGDNIDTVRKMNSTLRFLK